ncbi:MAG: hypothetical protein IJW43_04780 [Clostridia bacterium]|nr:hypothetical protein [Clostridia bacterium]
MDLSFLPQKFLDALSNVDLSSLYEIRIRLNEVVQVNLKGQALPLIKNGEYVYCDKLDIDYIISKLTEGSIYAFNEQIKKGFLAGKDGVRVGLAGTCVTDNDSVITIKDVSSLNVRLPHQIFGSASDIYNKLFLGGIYNTLIISPPFMGKTTLLKDLIRQLNESFNNILIIDERGEFASIKGKNIDKISYSSKQFAFDVGIRTMSPNIVIMDELCTKIDWESANFAVNNGVKLIATTHALDEFQLMNKRYFIKGVFERYVILDDVKKGVIKRYLDGDLNVF